MKKSIRITNEPTGFVLTRGDNGVKSLSADERELYDKLMKTRDTLLLDDTHASYVRDAKDALETSVKGKHDLKNIFSGIPDRCGPVRWSPWQYWRYTCWQ
ncbi:hypothetical protein MKQ70_04470 [Chitinophaga sedimenti]|uniref:hypothetical protein n=1 Tax=Chitinophaga sedimenti TaxID=2033606 RepID=UPI002004873D|nr:hypothetical protein [Chitinophaga sedimenti]MCK7554304.1 hypothetical protein [Chitinophaga sedimenti]